MRDRKVIEALIILALSLTTLVTFQYSWWTGYKFFEYKFFIITIILTTIILSFKNKIFYVLLLMSLLFINYAGIGSVFIVIFLWFTAYLIGKKVYEFLYKHDSEREILEFSALGFSIIGLIVTVSSHFPINFGIYYIALFAFFYIFNYASIIKTISSIRKFSLVDTKIDTLSLFILIICSAFLYMVTVIPDVGHDSLSTHLTIPKLIAQNYKWDYDVNKYIWSVLPMGVEMLYVPTYIFGGEDAVRILNTSFIMACGLQIYLIARKYYSNDNVAILFGLAFLSLPATFYLLGSTFVEPCYLFFILIAFTHLLIKPIFWLPMAIIFGYACTMRITGILFMPVILIYYLFMSNSATGKYKNFITISCFFLIFSTIPYIYSYYATGSPVFPLLNEIFKSDLWEKGGFYNPFYVNDLGISNIWYIIFNSEKYGEFSSSGTIGILMAIAIPFQLLYLLYSWKKIAYFKFEICILLSGFIYVATLFYVQAYLRYVFPGLMLIYLSFVVILSKANISLNVIKIFLTTVIVINILKIPYTSTFFPNNWEIYLNKSAKDKYISAMRPYAIAGQILDKFPEYKNSKILLVGYGYDPVYYYFPKNTVAYTWHSMHVYNLINDVPRLTYKLEPAVRKLGINIIVCPDIQVKEDDKNFSIQCKSITSKLFITNGVYVGLVNDDIK